MTGRVALDDFAHPSREAMEKLLDENAKLRSQLVAAQQLVGELELIADSDPLTPLPNRRAFVREFERAVAHVARHATPIAVMFVDLNRLKSVNDEYGHNAGDAALIHVAKVLSEHVRATDVVARIGGDEFGLVLYRLDAAAAKEKADMLVRHIAQTPIDVEGGTIRVGVSIGSTIIAPEDSFATALARADIAMYCAKRG